MVAGDGVHQFVLEDGKPITKAGDDVAPEIFACLQEQPVMALGGVIGRQRRQRAVQFIDAHSGENLIHIAQPPLLDGQQIPLFIPQIADVVDQGHQEVQFRTAPKVIGLLGTGGVLDNGVGHRLHQIRFRVQSIEAIPAIRVSHVQKVDRFDVVAVFPEVGRKLLEQFTLRIDTEYGLLPLGAAHQKRQDQAAGLPTARRTDAEKIVVLAGYHAVCHIGGVFVRVFRSFLDLAQQHPGDTAYGTDFQKGFHLPFGEEAGGAMRPVRENIEAPWVSRILIAGEPEIPALGHKAEHQHEERGGLQPKAGEYRQPVADRIKYPDGGHILPRVMKDRVNTKAHGVQEHPVKIPAHQSDGDVEGQLFLMPLEPYAPAGFNGLLQLFQQL